GIRDARDDRGSRRPRRDDRGAALDRLREGSSRSIVRSGRRGVRLRRPPNGGGRRMKIRISLLATALAAFLCAATGSAGTIVSDPALRSSTYAGGGGFEMGLGAAVDASGNMYVTGRTESSNYPTTPNAVSRGYRGGVSDAFVSKFGPGGDLIYSTYLGGAREDEGRGIGV